MGIYNKVYIGHVETINTNAYENEPVVENKVVALQLIGFDNTNKIPRFKPLRKYGEYYKLLNVEPISGYVSDSIINKKIKELGVPEVKQLKKVA